MARFPFSTLALALLLSTTFPGAWAQDLSGSESVVTGPYGVPRLVKNEGGNWEEPIKTYEDENFAAYVPDITSQGWAQWHVGQFRSDGSYFTYLYVYRKDARATSLITINVSTNSNQVKVDSFFGPVRMFEIANAPLPIARSIPKITAIVQDQSDRYRGYTIQEYIKAQRETEARLVCVLSDSCPAPPKASIDRSNSPVSFPVPIYTPEARYPDEARRLKITGIELLSTVIDVNGIPQDVKILRSLGHGLDEAALAAVHQYRFRPAIDRRTGRPVEKLMTIEVNFRLN